MTPRWQPPYPDPSKSYRVQHNAEKVSARLKDELRKHIRCLVVGCNNPADKRAMDGGVNICLHHLQKATLHMPDTLICTTCADFAAIEERAKARGVNRDHTLGHATIYYVQIADEIKIGWTTNIHQRMRAYPPSAKLLATEPGTTALERSRHQQFNEYLLHGREWFEPGQFLLEHIARVIEKHGEPPTVTTLRTPTKQSMPQRMNTGNYG